VASHAAAARSAELGSVRAAPTVRGLPASASAPISSSIRNAWIDFSSMDCSIVAIVSDVVRDGEPVVGYGFNSNGRYSAGEILRRRVLPRLLDAAPEDLLDEAGELDPRRA
jgi:hypothetical protein